MNETTKISDLINPEVMADMISAKIPEKIVVTPFAKIDRTLEGRPGDTITVPRYAYIGDAVDVAEGAACETNKLTATSAQYTVKKAMKAVEITDEAVLSGYGNPVGEANNQLSKAIANKIDNDALNALLDSTTVFDGTSSVISYDGVVDAVDKFAEEVQQDKVMFVSPKQLTTLRKDSDFISADKYPGNVVMTGEIGQIAGVRIVPSNKIVQQDAVTAVAGVYTITIGTKAASGDKLKVGEVEITAGGSSWSLSTDTAAGNATALASALNASSDPSVSCYTWTSSSAVLTATEDTGKEGTGAPAVVVTQAESGTLAVTTATTTEGLKGYPARYECPIVQLTAESETEDETAALTIYLKRGVNVESDRVSLSRKTDVSADEIYVAALTDVSKVVVAKFGVANG